MACLVAASSNEATFGFDFNLRMKSWISLDLMRLFASLHLKHHQHLVTIVIDDFRGYLTHLMLVEGLPHYTCSTPNRGAGIFVWWSHSSRQRISTARVSSGRSIRSTFMRAGRHKSFASSSLLRPACLRISARVPFDKSFLWSGTTTLIFVSP